MNSSMSEMAMCFHLGYIDVHACIKRETSADVNTQPNAKIWQIIITTSLNVMNNRALSRGDVFRSFLIAFFVLRPKAWLASHRPLFKGQFYSKCRYRHRSAKCRGRVIDLPLFQMIYSHKQVSERGIIFIHTTYRNPMAIMLQQNTIINLRNGLGICNGLAVDPRSAFLQRHHLRITK